MTMDFDFTEEQELIRTSARRFLSKECPSERVRETIDSRQGYDPGLWQKLADMGWLGLMFPVEYGGMSGDFLDLIVLQEELGRALVPSPFVQTVVLSGGMICSAGTEAQKKRLLPEIAKGDTIVSFALLESSGRWDPDGIKTAATGTAGGYVINGTKLFVPYGHVADYLICAVRTQEGSSGKQGVTLFLVDAAAGGISRKTMPTITGGILCEVTFTDIKVTEDDVVGEVNRGWDAVEQGLDEGAVAECGVMVGGARRALDLAVDYSRQRMQFGVPVGSFQAIQHKCADIFTEIDGAAFITYAAAWEINHRTPDASIAASKAKAWCSDMYTHVTSEGIQILGGIGFTQEHDMQLYFRRARASAAAFGDSQFHRQRIAEMLRLSGFSTV